MIGQFLLAVVALQTPGPLAGSVSGVVLNASQGSKPVAEAEVVLRVKLDGQFIVAAEGVADRRGRFTFDNIPASADYIYLPGANFADIHYPGPRISLDREIPHAQVELIVHDPVSEPNPLVIRRHIITVHPETDALRVTEELLIDNSSSRTYVGKASGESQRAATLHLSVPADFRRTTFHKEFYGRQFTLIDGQLVTDIPWPPGQRELAFTYVLPNTDRNRIWRRRMDLPCEHLQIKVFTNFPEEVSCNLAHVATSGDVVTFESNGKTLRVGHNVRLQLGRMPISVATYARWVALVLLVVLILVAVLVSMRSRRSEQGARSDGLRRTESKQAA